MTDYNITAEIAVKLTAQSAERLIEAYIDYHPGIGRAQSGNAELTITVPADHVGQAATTGVALLRGHRLVRLEILSTAEFDRRAGLEPMPELLSVSEAAEKLGVSRQAVLQRIEHGSLPAAKVGATWAVRAGAVER